MTAPIVNITDAVVSRLNGASLSLEFTAVRKYLSVLTLPETQTLQVVVVPARRNSELGGRGGTRHEYQVDVVVQKKIDPDKLTEPDQLMVLVQEIEDLFRFEALDSIPPAAWVKTETVKGAEAGYAFEHVDVKRLFTSVSRLTFTAERAR